MQASAYSTLKMGAVRVGAVLAGVLVATFLSVWIGLTWWSLGLAIAASLVLARIFRLGEQALEAPISAMLILGVTSPNVAAEVRILNTLIGAGVGIAFNLIYPPALPTRRAARAMIDVAEAAAAPLDAASQALTEGPIRREQVQNWLDRVRAGARRLTSATEDRFIVERQSPFQSACSGHRRYRASLVERTSDLGKLPARHPRALRGAARGVADRGQAGRPLRRGAACRIRCRVARRCRLHSSIRRSRSRRGGGPRGGGRALA